MEEDTGVQKKPKHIAACLKFIPCHLVRYSHCHDLMAKGKALCLDVIEELHKKGGVHPG